MLFALASSPAAAVDAANPWVGLVLTFAAMVAAAAMAWRTVTLNQKRHSEEIASTAKAARDEADRLRAELIREAERMRSDNGAQRSDNFAVRSELSALRSHVDEEMRTLRGTDTAIQGDVAEIRENCAAHDAVEEERQRSRPTPIEGVEILQDEVKRRRTRTPPLGVPVRKEPPK